jgi:hypothetical protein
MAKSPLRGKTALITGAAKRIGRATALALAAQGANVVVHYRASADEASALCRELEALGVGAWSVAADLRQPDQCETLIERAQVVAGVNLDILVNSASTFSADDIATVTFESIADAMRVNAWAPFALGRAFARQASEGRIVNLLDTRIAGYDWKHVSYILSKHALAVLTRMMAVEFAPHVAVNAVAPGLILPPPGQDDADLDALKDTVPLRRHGDAVEVAEVIAFLASSRFITGVIIYVDGGRHLWEYTPGPHPPPTPLAPSGDKPQ